MRFRFAEWIGKMSYKLGLVGEKIKIDNPEKRKQCERCNGMMFEKAGMHLVNCKGCGGRGWVWEDRD